MEIGVDLGRKLDELSDWFAATHMDADDDAAQTVRDRGLLVDVEPEVRDEVSCSRCRGHCVEHVNQMELASWNPHRDARGLVEGRPVSVGEVEADDDAELGAGDSRLGGSARRSGARGPVTLGCHSRFEPQTSSHRRWGRPARRQSRTSESESYGRVSGGAHQSRRSSRPRCSWKRLTLQGRGPRHRRSARNAGRRGLRSPAS